MHHRGTTMEQYAGIDVSLDSASVCIVDAHCKSLPAQEVRALLTTRKLLQAKRHDVEMSLRGMLRGFGLKVRPTTPKTFAGRVRDLVAHHDTLQTIADALLKARAVLEQEFKAIEKRLYRLARANEPTRRLMTTPGVGAIVALTFAEWGQARA